MFVVACSNQLEPTESQPSLAQVSVASSAAAPVKSAPARAAPDQRLAPVASAAPSGNVPTSAPLQIRRDGQQHPAAAARRVLHFGDSMVPLVGNYLKPAVEKAGGRYTSISTASARTVSWADDERLPDAIEQQDPELVLVSLGSNELYVSELDAPKQAIRRIVAQIGDRACLWIGPPAWNKRRQFLNMLAQTVAPCRYFDSTKLKFKRQQDGRHPTFGSSHRWASEVWKQLGGTEGLAAD